MHNRLRLAKRNWFISVAVATLLALAAVPAACAQTNAMDIAGAQLAQGIVHNKQHSVAVLDFSGPGRNVTVLGEQLADQFSAGMAKAGQAIQVEDRAQITKVRNENSYAPEIVLDPESFMVLAEDLNVQAVVTGELSAGPNNTVIADVKSYRVKNGKGIVGLKVTLPMTAEMKLLIAKSASSPIGPNLEMGTPQLAAGYKPPRCLLCPRPDYTPAAMRLRAEGTVILAAIVGLDGHATNITVLKALPGGLTASAIAVLQTWKLAPATDPKGNAVVCRELFEMTFRLR